MYWRSRYEPTRKGIPAIGRDHLFSVSMKHARIRDYVPEDAAFLCRIFFEAVRITGLRDYSEAQVHAWAPQMPDPADFAKRVGDGRFVLTAVDRNDLPVGYGEVERSGHIDHLYCLPEMGRTGIGSALYDRLEQKAHELGIPRLFVEASEGAHRLFSRKGFVDVERREVLLRGVSLHHYVMEKWLRE